MANGYRKIKPSEDFWALLINAPNPNRTIAMLLSSLIHLIQLEKLPALGHAKVLIMLDWDAGLSGEASKGKSFCFEGSPTKTLFFCVLARCRHPYLIE